MLVQSSFSSCRSIAVKCFEMDRNALDRLNCIILFFCTSFRRQWVFLSSSLLQRVILIAYLSDPSFFAFHISKMLIVYL